MEEHDIAFNKVKRLFAEASPLFLINPRLSFGLETDASTVGLGARLFQFDPATPEREFNVAYASRSLTNAEKNYTTTEQEALALKWALTKFRIILEGRKVKVKTDHSALRFLTSCSINTFVE